MLHAHKSISPWLFYNNIYCTPRYTRIPFMTKCKEYLCPFLHLLKFFWDRAAVFLGTIYDRKVQGYLAPWKIYNFLHICAWRLSRAWNQNPNKEMFVIYEAKRSLNVGSWLKCIWMGWSERRDSLFSSLGNGPRRMNDTEHQEKLLQTYSNPVLKNLLRSEQQVHVLPWILTALVSLSLERASFVGKLYSKSFLLGFRQWWTGTRMCFVVLFIHQKHLFYVVWSNCPTKKLLKPFHVCNAIITSLWATSLLYYELVVFQNL